MALEAELPFGKAIQLGSGREISINQLVALMRQVAGEDAFTTVKYAPPRPGEVLRNYVSIARAGKYLGFSPVTDLQTGLQKTWKWFQGKGGQRHAALDLSQTSALWASQSKDHTFLVTGSAGFIGFHAARALLSQGARVVGLDNYNDYYSPALKRGRDLELRQYPNFVSLEGDLADLPLLEALFKSHAPNKICHLAAQAGVRYSLVNPFAYQKSNLEGFLNLLELAKRNQVECFVYASSSSVYAGLTEMPFAETQRVDTPISLYAASKKANELMAHTYSHLFGLPTVGLRFFTVYGPWGRPDMAMWLFTEAMLTGKPIKVFNYGKMRRDFTYIDDIVQGVLAALMAPGLETYEVINLGNHRCEELTRVIELLEHELGVKARQDLLPIQPGDVPATFADIARAREKLGFQPTTPIEVGVPRFVQWYLDYHGRVGAQG